MDPRLTCIVLLLAGVHAGAHAQFFKCKDANGKVTIQDTRCPADPNAPARTVPVPGQKDEAASQRSKTAGAGANWDPDRKVAPASPVTVQRPPGGGPGTITIPEDQLRGLRDIQERQQRQAAMQAKNVRPPDCKQARRQVELLKSDKPLAAYGAGGRVHMLEGKDRPAELARAEQDVAHCVDK